MFACIWAVPGCTRRETFDDANGRFHGAVPERTATVAATSDPSAYFTAISGVDVDSRGRIYVGDIFQQQITILGPDGSVVRGFGRRGSGPGEFQAIRGVQVLGGDSILVYDPGLGRVSVFGPGGDELAYVVNLAATGASWFTVWRVRATGQYWSLFRAPHTSSQAGAGRVEVLSRLGADGTALGEPVLSQPARSSLVAGRSITPNPFGGQGLLAVNSAGVVHRLWNRGTSIDRFAADGGRLPALTFDHEPLPVSPDDVDAELSAFDARARGVFEQALRDSVPSHWPAVRDMVIDDQDRIWLELAGPPQRPASWLLLHPDGRPAARVRLPPRSTVWRIHGDLMYVEGADETDASRIHVMRIR
jgi:hypothetical protein